MAKKRLIGFMALILCGVMLLGISPQATLASFSVQSINIINRVADPDTSNNTGFIDIHRLHDGRIWTDKTVQEGLADDEFNITLSALAQSFPLTEGYAIPADTVFAIDVSGSMAGTDVGVGRSRIDLLIEALNEAIHILQDANPLNRVAVVAYGGRLGGYGRVEILLPLGRYTVPSGIGEFFSYISSPSVANQHLRLNVGTNPRSIYVEGSTPTQWGIREGARILENVTDTTALVPETDADGNVTRYVTVNRRPNIILMTDGEPTMGRPDFYFESPAPIAPGPTGGQLTQATEIAGVRFYGDGSYGEQALAVMTVLTAAYRRRTIQENYFPGGALQGDAPRQPTPSVGFFTISVGDQPSLAARNLITATLNPTPENTAHILPNVRHGMDLGSFDPGPPDTTPTMAAILNNFATGPDTGNFYAQYRYAYGTYQWTSLHSTVNIENTVGLTPGDLNYADYFFEATDLTGLRAAFHSITSSIQQTGNYPIVDVDDDPDVDGWLVFSDVLGEYMQFRGTPTLTFPPTFNADGTQIHSGAVGTPINLLIYSQRSEFEAILYAHMDYETPRDEIADLLEASIAAGFTSSVRYFADSDRNFVGNYSTTAIPSAAVAVVELFPMAGPSVPSPLDVTQQTSLMYVAFHVLTVLRPATFTEIFAGTIGGTPMERTLAAGDQFIRWYIPASLIPQRTVSVATTVTGNREPIRVEFTVGLDRARVAAGVSDLYVNANSSPDTGEVFFYSNRWRNNTNVTLAFFRPHDLNPWYHGDITRPIVKSSNNTATANHSSYSRSVEQDGHRVDSHWLGNNGRLSLGISGQLMITKAFSFNGGPFTQPPGGILPSFEFVVETMGGVEVMRIPFDTNNFSWNSGLNRYELTPARRIAAGTYRVRKVPTITDIDDWMHLPQPGWNTVTVPASGVGVVNFINKYVTQLQPHELPGLRIRKLFHGLPAGVFPPDFEIIVVGPLPDGNTPVHPQTGEGALQGWTLNADNRYEIRFTAAQSTSAAGIVLLNITPGIYEIFEINYDGVNGFLFDRISYIERELTDGTIYNYNVSSTVPVPLHFVDVEAEDDYVIRVDNFYIPARPPVTPGYPGVDGLPTIIPPAPVTPQTGVSRNLILPIIAIALGAGALVAAGFYVKLSKNSKKNNF